jgi:hypothetical protein
MDTKEYNELKSEWLAALLQLWHAYGKKPDPAQVKTYVTQLGHIKLGMLEGAVAHLLASHVYNSVPTIAEVLQAVDDTNRHDWRDIEGYTKVYSHPHREFYQLHRKEYSIGEYKKSWAKH